MADDSNTLDDLLDAEPVTEAQPTETIDDGVGMEAVAETPEPQQETGEPETATPAAEQPDDGPYVPRKALEDERRKRQAGEQKLQEMNAWIAQQQQAMQRQQQPQLDGPPTPEIDWWSDPEAAAQYQTQQFESRLDQALAQRDQQMIQMKFELSEEFARTRYEDYDDTIKVFEEAITQMPREQGQMLFDQMKQAANPAAFAYQTAKQMQTMQQVGSDPNAYREQIRQEILAEMNGDPQARSQSPQTASIPRSLAGKTNSKPRNDRGQFVEHASLDELLE